MAGCTFRAAASPRVRRLHTHFRASLTSPPLFVFQYLPTIGDMVRVWLEGAAPARTPARRPSLRGSPEWNSRSPKLTLPAAVACTVHQGRGGERLPPQCAVGRYRWSGESGSASPELVCLRRRQAWAPLHCILKPDSLAWSFPRRALHPAQLPHRPRASNLHRRHMQTFAARSWAPATCVRSCSLRRRLLPRSMPVPAPQLAGLLAGVQHH